MPDPSGQLCKRLNSQNLNRSRRFWQLHMQTPGSNSPVTGHGSITYTMLTCWSWILISTNRSLYSQWWYTLSATSYFRWRVASRAHRAKWDWEMSRISWSAASRQNHGMSQLNTGKTPRLRWSLANGIRDAMPCNEFRLNTYLSQTNPSFPTGMKSPDWSPSPVERWKYAAKLP